MTSAPLATPAGGRESSAPVPVPVTRKQADAWLKANHPDLTGNARKDLAATVPTVQRADPSADVFAWLETAALIKKAGGRIGYRAMTRGQNPTMTTGLDLAGKPHLADEFDAHRRDGERYDREAGAK